MGPYLGDFQKSSTVCFCWDTNSKFGESVNRDAAGTIRIYCDGDVGECAVGVLDTQAFDGLAGINKCSIDLAADSFYSPGHDYTVVLVGATIDGESINAVLAGFSIENRYSASPLFSKAAKVIVNRAVQNKITGAISYYDDDSQTVILTHTPTDSEGELAREMS